MAYANKLNSEAFNRIYDALEKHVSDEATSMYRANSCKSGQYKGQWSEVFDDWLADKVPNLEIYQMLETGIPYTF